MTDKLQLVNFEQAKRLKKLGFDYPVDNYYHETNNDNDTPLEFGRERALLNKLLTTLDI